MRRLSSIAWRLLWRSVAGLIVFAQVAVASDLCLPEPLPGERLAVAVADGNHDFTSHCAEDRALTSQAPASQAERPAPDLGVLVRTDWDITSVTGTTPASHAPIRAGPSLRLQFRNLRL